MKTGVMLSEMAVVINVFTLGSTGLSSGFSSVTICVTITFLLPNTALKSVMVTPPPPSLNKVDGRQSAAKALG